MPETDSKLLRFLAHPVLNISPEKSPGRIDRPGFGFEA